MIEFQRGDMAVGVGNLPMRKSICVTVRRGVTVYAAAYCRNDAEAERLIDALCELTGTRRDSWEVEAA